MNKWFACIIFCCSLCSTFGQNDTLADKDYTELTLIIREHIADTTTAFKLLDYYIDKAQKEQLPEREFEGLFSISLLYFQNNLPFKSAEWMDRVMQFRQKHDIQTQETRTYSLAMGAYLRAAQVKKAYAAANKTLEIAEKTDNIALKSSTAQYLDLLDALGGNFRATIENSLGRLSQLEQGTIEGLTEETYDQQLTLTESVLAQTYLRMKEGDSSLIYSKRILARSVKNQDSCQIKFAYLQMAEAEVLIEAYENAQKHLKEATLYCAPLTKMDSLLLGGALGRMHFQKREYTQAITVLEKTFDTYQFKEAEEAYTLDYYKLLAESYKEIGSFEKANLYFEKYVNSTEKFSLVKDTLQNGKNTREINAFRKELRSLEAKKQNNFNYLLLGGSILILVLLLILLKFYRNKKADAIKFEALLAKVNNANSPNEIINSKDEVLDEKVTHDLPEETREEILQGLKKLEEKEYFLKQECNSYNVAKKIGTNTSYLSKVINSHYEKNFNTYINDLRINYAIVRLKDDVIFRSYSIQSIAEELGYKSADSFTKYFKKDTGLNPSFYIKNIKNLT